MIFGVYLLILRRAVLRYIWRPPQGKGQATGGLRLPAGKQSGILTEIQTKVNKKMTKNALFLPVDSKLSILTSPSMEGKKGAIFIYRRFVGVKSGKCNLQCSILSMKCPSAILLIAMQA